MLKTSTMPHETRVGASELGPIETHAASATFAALAKEQEAEIARLREALAAANALIAESADEKKQLDDRLQAAERELDAVGLRALVANAQWIPVTERLPEPYRTVVAWKHDTRIGHRFVTCDYMIRPRNLPGPVWRHASGDKSLRVTHWMPLPAPPVDALNETERKP